MAADEASLGILIFSFLALIVASAYFSSSETGMMSLNKYRMNHLRRGQHAGATRASKLLEKPDKLIGVILIGNNFVNFLAASIASSITILIIGEPAPFTTAIVLTLVVLIFAEVTPKTIAALYPERIAYPSSIVLGVLLKVLYPIVWAVNFVSNTLVRTLGFHPQADSSDQQLSQEELRTVVHESESRLPKKRQGMLLNILDLEKVQVDQIMVPRNEVTGLDIEDAMEDVLEQIASAQHTRLPVYRKDIDNIVGVLHMRSAGRLIKTENLNKAAIIQETTEPYFIPDSTPLHTQLFNFQSNKLRLAVVVDEFGAVKGIVTLEDILEEIVGEIDDEHDAPVAGVRREADGSYLVQGSVTIRDLNREFEWKLPTEDYSTVAGLVLHEARRIPEVGQTYAFYGLSFEILRRQRNQITLLRIRPPEMQLQPESVEVPEA